ncbi:hypothetical protein NQ176_g4837 [Zarea fungicola]|uniref:Uncharacterized protein n=1 Tax=Zarea fungicola TaxID=93591 RepID=A0ACC1NCC9_9HYPO|nr:hypothetical protein NQ176_g4837 [Lecanicillium fungicola]
MVQAPRARFLRGVTPANPSSTQVYCITLQSPCSGLPFFTNPKLTVSPSRITLLSIASALLNPNSITDQTQTPERQHRSFLTISYANNCYR